MSLPEVVSHDEWRAARKRLLAEEKAMTRARDALNTKRRQLPMVRVEKDYRFRGPGGEVGLLDLFQGRRQLFLQHFMFDPAGRTAARAAPPPPTRSPKACCGTWPPATRPSPSSRAPLDTIERYKSSADGPSPGTRRSGATSTTTTRPPSTPRSRRPSTTSVTPPSSRRPARGGCWKDLGSSPASACSCATATPSSTPTRCTPAAPRVSAVRTTGST